MRYVAFLRGINLGGRTVKMDTLKESFEQLGFENVKTLIASGNVLFDSKEQDLISLKQKIEKKLQATFGFSIDVILRTQEQIQNLIDADPFKGKEGNPKIKLYVTFVSEDPNEDVFTVRDLDEGGTTDMMTELDKKNGKHITTRNWNTLKKLVLL